MAGDKEIELIVGEMRRGFDQIEISIKTICSEQKTENNHLHDRITKLSQDGCAQKKVHEQLVTDLSEKGSVSRKSAAIFGSAAAAFLTAVVEAIRQFTK